MSFRLCAEDEKESGELLRLHEAVDLIVEGEEEMLDKHMEQIQENAALLTEEGKLVQSVQGKDVVDYDIDDYTTKLEKVCVGVHPQLPYFLFRPSSLLLVSLHLTFYLTLHCSSQILRKKVEMAQMLLKRVVKFRKQLAAEEKASEALAAKYR